MFYFDYTWKLYPDSIVLDQELDTDKLGWKGGDVFKLVEEDGRMKLIKIIKEEINGRHSRID
jgi:hypothetical protein